MDEREEKDVLEPLDEPETGVPDLELDEQDAASVQGGVSNIMKTKHDTVKN